MHTLRNLRLHHLNDSLIASLQRTLLSNLRELLVEVFFDLFLGSELGDHVLHPHIDHTCDLNLIGLDTVDLRLVKEELLDGYLLGNDAVEIPFECEPLTASEELLILNIREKDRFVTDHPDDFVHSRFLLRLTWFCLRYAQRAQGKQTE